MIPTRRRDIPVPLARFIRSSVVTCSTNSIRYEWEPVDDEMVPRAMDRYFGVKAASNQSCELFLIEDVPAAAMMYTVNNTQEMPDVDSFHLNKGLLILFDAGSHMCTMLYKRYNHITMQNALNANEFRSCDAKRND